jgi:hypothetical protein
MARSRKSPYGGFEVTSGHSHWGRSSSGFSGIFEIVAADEAGDGWLKKETRLRRDIDCRPSLALRHPCRPICPRELYLPKRRRAPGHDAQPGVGQLTRERAAPCVQLGQRLIATEGDTDLGERRAALMDWSTRRARTATAATRWPFATLAPRSSFASPTCPRGRRGRERYSIIVPGQRTSLPVGAVSTTRAPTASTHAAGFADRTACRWRCAVTTQGDPISEMRPPGYQSLRFGRATRNKMRCRERVRRDLPHVIWPL